MTRKKKTINGHRDLPADTAANHRTFTMLSSSEPVPALPPSPSPPPPVPLPPSRYDHVERPPMRTSPYQKEAIVVDRVPVASYSSSDLEGGSDEAKERGKGRGAGCCLFVAKYLLIFLLVFCLLFGLSYLVLGSLVESKASLKASQSFGLAGKYSLALGVVLLLMAIAGIMAALSRSKIPAIVFIVLILAHAALQVVSTMEVSKRIKLLDQDANVFWDTLEDPLKVSVQKAFNCCGFEGPDDRPGPICPEGADGGCAAHVRAAADEIGRSLHISLYAALGVDAILLILIVLIMILNARRR